jgi:hypothetical protein
MRRGILGRLCSTVSSEIFPSSTEIEQNLRDHEDASFPSRLRINPMNKCEQKRENDGMHQRIDRNVILLENETSSMYITTNLSRWKKKWSPCVIRLFNLGEMSDALVMEWEKCQSLLASNRILGDESLMAKGNTCRAHLLTIDIALSLPNPSFGFQLVEFHFEFDYPWFSPSIRSITVREEKLGIPLYRLKQRETISVLMS